MIRHLAVAAVLLLLLTALAVAAVGTTVGTTGNTTTHPPTTQAEVYTSADSLILAVAEGRQVSVRVGDTFHNLVDSFRTIAALEAQVQALTKLIENNLEPSVVTLAKRLGQVEKSIADQTTLDAIVSVKHDFSRLSDVVDDLAIKLANEVAGLNEELQDVRDRTGAIKPAEDLGGTGGTGQGKLIKALQSFPDYGLDGHDAYKFNKLPLGRFDRISTKYFMWQLPRGGNYLAMVTTASYQRGSTAFAKFRVNIHGPQSDRMISEFFAASGAGWTSVSLVTSFVWKIVTKTIKKALLNGAAYYDGEAGIVVNQGGLTEVCAVRVPDSLTNRNNHMTLKLSRRMFGTAFADTGHFWMANGKGHYFLSVTIRTYASKATCTGFLRLRNERTGFVEKSVRVMQGFVDPHHNWHNHGMTFIWKVQNSVKARTRFFLQGSGTGNGCIGLQNDQNGWASTTVYPVSDDDIASRAAGAVTVQVPEGAARLPNVPNPIGNGIGWQLPSRTGNFLLYGTVAVEQTQGNCICNVRLYDKTAKSYIGNSVRMVSSYTGTTPGDNMATIGGTMMWKVLVEAPETFIELHGSTSCTDGGSKFITTVRDSYWEGGWFPAYS